MKTRILCFLILLMGTCSLSKVFGQWEGFNTTPFTLYYVLDYDNQSSNIIPREIKELGGDYSGLIGTAKFYNNKVVLNGKKTFEFQSFDKNHCTVFVSPEVTNLSNGVIVGYGFTFCISKNRSIAWRDPDPYLSLMYFDGEYDPNPNAKWIRVLFYTENEFRQLQNASIKQNNTTSVPINTYSGGYDNNNTNNNTNTNSGQKTCSFCGGTGWITNDDAPDFIGGTKWCSRCNKEVRMSHSHEKCPSCGGSGKSW